MADRVGFHLIWSLLLLITATLSTIGFASPNWVQEGPATCGIITYSCDSTLACDTSFSKYGGVSDIPNDFWKASAFLIGAACVVMWVCFILSVITICCAQDMQIMLHNIVSLFGFILFAGLLVGLAGFKELGMDSTTPVPVHPPFGCRICDSDTQVFQLSGCSIGWGLAVEIAACIMTALTSVFGYFVRPRDGVSA